MGIRLHKAVEQIAEAFSRSDVIGMRRLSNKMIEQAAIENSKMLASVAMTGYALHKLSTKTHIVSNDKWLKVRGQVLISLKKAIKALERGDTENFEKTMTGIAKEVNSADAKLGYFTDSIYKKASIKYASTAYSLGLSLSQASSLTGADIKDVLDYIGATRISDREKSPLGINDRLKKMRELL